MVTPFQLAWDLLKANLSTARREEEAELMRRLMNGEILSTIDIARLVALDDEPRPFNPELAIAEIENKDDLRERSLDRGWNEEEDEQAVREFVNRQPQKPNFGIMFGKVVNNIPMQTEQTRLPTLSSSKMLNPVIGNAKLKEMNRRIAENKNKPYRLGSNSHQVDQEVIRNNNIRRFKDKREAAKLHLRDNPPHLRRLEEKDMQGGNLYNIMSGKNYAGHVGVEGENNRIGYGEVLPAYQRLGLYGKTLQGIINEREVLHSTNRNQNSQPFHQQFNPPNTGKHLDGRELNRNATYTYRAFPPQETPENWGALEYDTGALPIYQEKPPVPTLNPRDREQASLARWGYIPGDARYN